MRVYSFINLITYTVKSKKGKIKRTKAGKLNKGREFVHLAAYDHVRRRRIHLGNL